MPASFMSCCTLAFALSLTYIALSAATIEKSFELLASSFEQETTNLSLAAHSSWLAAIFNALYFLQTLIPATLSFYDNHLLPLLWHLLPKLNSEFLPVEDAIPQQFPYYQFLLHRQYFFLSTIQ